MGDGGEVVDEAVVAEEGAAFGEEDVFVAGAVDFFDGVGHFPWGHELAFFDVDGFAGLSGGLEEVGLAAEEGGDLQEVDGVGGGDGLVGFVDVGGDGDADLIADGGENFEAFVQAEAAIALGAGAVGLVEGGFEDVGDVEAGRRFP